MKRVAIFLAAGLAAVAGGAAETGAAPKGEVTKYVFTNSVIFPGTTREYFVYVPRQYDPAKPACLHVNQDGVQFNAPDVFDRLIASGAMPVTIGVFVKPGVVKALTTNALDRFNRSFEYDGMGDGYARFLIEELLPEVEKKTTSDGRAIKFSHDGNDRSIGGSSSGAICAFTAAWERPDAFRRVFSSIGTYVGLRGGNEYPTLIRKTEPKPLRVFLQDGSNDLNIYGGDWWMANQEMERALRFAGYEVNHAWGEGGHSGKHATEIFADAMTWLWQGWPHPIAAGSSSNAMLHSLLIPGEGWQEVASDDKRGEELNSSTTFSPDKSLLYRIEKASRWVDSFQVLPDGSLTNRQHYFHLHVTDEDGTSGASSLCVDREGRLYVATNMGVQICDQAGRVNVILPVPAGNLRVICFGGEKHDVLFITSGGHIFKRKLNTRGVNPEEPPFKPAAPRL